MNYVRYIFFVLLAFIVMGTGGMAQNVGVGTATPDSSARLEVQDTSRGMLIPRLTEDQRDSIKTPAEGLLIYQTDSNAGFYYYQNSRWVPIVGALTGERVVRRMSFQVFPAAGESSFSTSSTSYVDVGKQIQNGIPRNFPGPLPGTKRYYRLKVSFSNNLPGIDSMDVRYTCPAGTPIVNVNLPQRWASSNYVNQRVSQRFQTSCTSHAQMQTRINNGSYTLWIWGIWVIAEDMVEY